jgi:hypothetical protein
MATEEMPWLMGLVERLEADGLVKVTGGASPNAEYVWVSLP